MFNIVVLVSGGGTNLQAIIDNIENGNLKDVRIAKVISNNGNAFALKRAAKHGIEGEVISPKFYPSREIFNDALKTAIDAAEPDLIVLAGFLVVVPPEHSSFRRRRHRHRPHHHPEGRLHRGRRHPGNPAEAGDGAG